MKPLSESLMELAGQVKRFEEASAGAREKNRATLEREGHEFEKTAGELREAAQKWWSDTREAVEHQIGVMRADFEKWQTELKAQHAKDAAQPGAGRETAVPAAKS